MKEISSKESTDYIKDITEIENITKDYRRHEGNQSTSMILHHHPNSSTQKGRWSRNAEPLMFSLKHASCRRHLGTAS
jgi:hypothetical protein